MNHEVSRRTVRLYPYHSETRWQYQINFFSVSDDVNKNRGETRAEGDVQWGIKALGKLKKANINIELRRLGSSHGRIV